MIIKRFNVRVELNHTRYKFPLYLLTPDVVINKVVMLCLFCRELHDPSFLDAINSLLVAGEYPHLFSNDEMEGLLQVRFLTT